jgi:EAL domain-containing protein (putative c-di-GMP-specific phosphodiesterase class I)
LGFFSPAEFIPVAEKSGLIVEIGEWVVVEVNRQLKQWQMRSDWPSVGGRIIHTRYSNIVPADPEV